MLVAWVVLIAALHFIGRWWPQYGEVSGSIVFVVMAPFFAIPLVAVYLGWQLGSRWDRQE